MAAMGVVEVDEHHLKYLFESYGYLTDTKQRLEADFEEIEDFKIEARKFWKDFNDKETAASVNDSSPLNTIVSIKDFVEDEFDVLKELICKMDLNMCELEREIQDVGYVLFDADYIVGLVGKIKLIQRSIAIKLKDFKENKDVNLFRQMLTTKKSE